MTSGLAGGHCLHSKKSIYNTHPYILIPIIPCSFHTVGRIVDLIQIKYLISLRRLGHIFANRDVSRFETVQNMDADPPV